MTVMLRDAGGRHILAFARRLGIEHCPWPTKRAEELRREYTSG